jgi:hypothetical protein
MLDIAAVRLTLHWAMDMPPRWRDLRDKTVLVAWVEEALVAADGSGFERRVYRKKNYCSQ